MNEEDLDILIKYVEDEKPTRHKRTKSTRMVNHTNWKICEKCSCLEQCQADLKGGMHIKQFLKFDKYGDDNCTCLVLPANES